MSGGYRSKGWNKVPLTERCKYWHGLYTGRLSEKVRNTFHHLYNELYLGTAPDKVHIKNLQMCDEAIAELESTKKPINATYAQIEDLKRVKEMLMQVIRPDISYTSNISKDRKSEIFKASLKRQQERKAVKPIKVSSLLQKEKTGMNEILVTLVNGEKCRVRIEIPQEIFTQNSSDAEHEYIENWLRTNMQNVREWSE